MKKLTVYYFCFEGFKKIGRLNNHITETVNRFSELGNQVYFFNPDIITPELDKSIIQKLIPVINTPVLKYLTYDFISFFTMCINALKQPPDIIYYRESSSLVPLLVARLFSRPLFIEINGWVVDELAPINYAKYKLRLIKFIQTINYKNADRLIPVSNGLKKLITKNYQINPEKISVVNNGTNPEKYYPIEKSVARKKINLGRQRKIIGFIGGCYPHHGIQYLIKTAPLLIKKYQDILFVVAGDGIMLESWKKLAIHLNVAEHFYFPGNVPYDLAPFYINAFDICVAPWDKDLVGKVGLSPMKLFDYLACARPVIASSVDGIDDIVTKNDIGTTVDVNDPDKFARAIIAVYENIDKFEEKARRGYEFVINQYTWQQTSEQIYQLMVNEINDTKINPNNIK